MDVCYMLFVYINDEGHSNLTEVIKVERTQK